MYYILVLCTLPVVCMASHQAYFADNTQWNVRFESSWDVLGPFPIHAREQHFLSPAFPLNLSQPIDYAQTWPSSYADGGSVKWSKATSNDGNLEISFPEIRWKALRSTEGWAALQHHAILRTTVTLFPPANPISSAIPDFPQLLIDLKQGSYFALRPQARDTLPYVPEWYAGNIYDLERALPHSIELPSVPSLTHPSKYDIFVSGDYEIRLFGDPLVRNSDTPVQKLKLDIQVQDKRSPMIHQESQDVICDFLGGYAFGDAIGIGIQSASHWWSAKDVRLKYPIAGMNLWLQSVIAIAPSQTRVLPIVIEQTAPYFGDSIEVDITITSGDISKDLSVVIPVIHRYLPLSEGQSIKGSFFFANSTPSSFIAIPPRTTGHEEKALPILALHGAGVDVLTHTFWIQSLPANKVSWMIAPTGRTSWGLDWHGPSVHDAWSALESLARISRQGIHAFPKSWEIPVMSEVVVVGHSNGGQGAWYISSRFPDRVLAVVPAAGYIKSQSYIPLTHGRNGHFIDPALRSILESSLTPDDNDLHISNLVDTPILAIHGGDDENVPVWHSRETTAVLKAWCPSANITFREDKGKGHWYPEVIKSAEVQEFLDNNLSSSYKPRNSESFTLTVANTQESGPLHGWSIDKLVIPGRLGRLHVQRISNVRFEVEPSNVDTFTVPVREEPFEVYVDNMLVLISRGDSPKQVRRDTAGKWEVELSKPAEVLNNPGRMQSILSSPGPVKFVVSGQGEGLSVALRLAHILGVYHKIDAEIIPEEIALAWDKFAWPPGNVVFIGLASSRFVLETLQSQDDDVIRIIESTPYVGTRRFSKPGQALLFLNPHHTRNDSLMMFLLYNDKAGLERAARLFPFRTGVAVPDWIAVGQKMDSFGAGGIEAAGLRDSDWKLSPQMTWFYV